MRGVAWLLLAVAVPAAAQSGMRDRYFTRYPFDKWKAEGPALGIKSAGIRWTPRTLPVVLSPNQRLLARIEVELDAREAAKRHDQGELAIFLELTDAAGRRWRTHQAFDLARIPADAQGQPVVFVQDALVRPGDYQLAMAICDSRTLEHSFVTRALHVAPLRGDPLPEFERDFPQVEYVRVFAPPDNWFQPYQRGRPRLLVEARRPVHVDIVMNMTPSDRGAGSVRVFRRNMSVLVPALKLLAGMTIPDGTLDVTLLDLTQRRIWEQLNARGLDWSTMREPFAETNPGIIDIQSLAGKAEMLQFFSDRVAGKLAPREGREPLRVVIVLSAPAFLEHQGKLGTAPFPKDPNRRVFYIRYQPTPRMGVVMAPDGSTTTVGNAPPWDDLERVMKGFDGRMFGVTTPEAFRKALAAILQEISRM